MISTRVGESIPPNTKHAVSVCLPTWRDTVGYEESDPSVVEKMTTGYPRFFIHKSIQKLCDVLAEKYAKLDEKCLVFPSYEVAKRCREYVKIKAEQTSRIRILQLSTPEPASEEERTYKHACKIAVLFFAPENWPLVKQYWQHSGEITSSRMAEYILQEFSVVEKNAPKTHLSRLNSAAQSESTNSELQKDEEEYIEQRFGRNLDFSYGDKAKLLVKKRIAQKVVDVDENDQSDRNGDSSTTSTNAGSTPLTADSSTVPAEPIEQDVQDLSISHTPDGLQIDAEKDVFLFPSGMASIFTSHRLLLSLDSRRVFRRQSGNAEGTGYASSHSSSTQVVGYGPPYKKTVLFGFPYTDTLSILRKFNHTHFLGTGDLEAMNELKQILHSGEQILAVFLETPSNPLLKMGDLRELRELADAYGFFIVADETIGGFVNIDVLPYADIVCSSLTKIFSGDSNVMAGSLVLNPRSRVYGFAQEFMTSSCEDLLWCEDAIYLERNSRDFVSRTLKINANTEFLLNQVLLPQQGKLFKKIYYPSETSPETKKHYDAVKCPSGGYGGLLSLTFYNEPQAHAFFDNLELCKGPSLGTNFTLACPYTILAHYSELDEVLKYGVETLLVRVSVGLEGPVILKDVFTRAIDAAQNAEQPHPAAVSAP
ncbi:LAMI_0C00848g1_1 [Lachancea mirantina]|uniref:cystathionine gamma-synthase n=1 Tax=Lachancea mirantina TaxID=1230905 RepID=A0A1G4IZQ7_9SACH|nr:LAMI_0C00848g1_1 [Lachancea mirantina]